MENLTKEQRAELEAMADRLLDAHNRASVLVAMHTGANAQEVAASGLAFYLRLARAVGVTFADVIDGASKVYDVAEE